MFLTGPDEEFVPEHLRGQLAIVVVMVFTGPEAGARIAMAPMMGHGHLAEMIAEMPYADLNSSFDDPAGMRNYYSAEYLFDLPDEAIDRVCARAGDMVVPSSSAIAMARQGGAVGDGPSGYPVPWRAASWIIHPLGIWDDPADDERMITFTHNLCGDVAEWATGSVYLNFIGDEGRARTIAGFGADNYERLVAVKDQYDPDNVFHHNHNIEPSLAR
ncbi:BBE domain-containing protein [Salinibacterium sp. G-O1]|uniref:BBE domain-containing protein n=1 Tax=Salinibacterium sp. G-O1 TaxID=3046208 RepID=UPI0024B9E447|nr:BBE domain-containing protein [Salinibacterium sp. G-O1]MDJ0334366.1 BBE domain-containing protein [Salinibacterium sp. G-O1]